MNHTITLNGESHALSHSPLALTELLTQLNATAPGYAIALNGKVVPREHWDSTFITTGDALLLIQPIAGG